MSENTTDFFDNIGGGSGAPTATLKGVGDFVHGEVVEMFKRDYIPYGKKDPEIKEDGTKRQQLVVILQTTNRNWAGVVKVPKVDPNDADSPEKPASEDDGLRALYCPEKSNIQYAVGRAVSFAQAPFEVGGILGVKIANLKDTGKGNPLKEHEAVYKAKPAPTGDEFFNQPSASAPTSAPAAEAAPAPTSTPAPAASTPAEAVDPWATSAPAGDSKPPF